MIHNLYSIYFSLTQKCMQLGVKPTTKLLRKAYSIMFQTYLNKIVIKEFEKNPTIPDRTDKRDYIGSMTTFGVRAEKVWVSIESLLRQTKKLDHIIVWLEDKEYDSDYNRIPQTLKDVVARCNGVVEVRFCVGIRAYKKLWFAKQDFPESNIITFDDDVIYPVDTVEKIMELHEKYPEDIVCISGEEISGSFFALPDSWDSNRGYNHFGHVNHDYKLRVMGLSGVLYPPKCFYEPDVFNLDLMKKLCPWNDDLWWTVMAALNGTKISRYEFRSNPLGIWCKGKLSLSNGTDKTSTRGITNDDQWKTLTDYYHEQLEKIVE